MAESARGAYIAAVCHPNATYNFSGGSQVINPESNNFKAMNKQIKLLSSTNCKVPNFVPLDLDYLVMAVFVDDGFGANPDSSSQLGLLITLMDKHACESLIRYGSLKSKRITESALSLELLALVHGFDISSTIRLAINYIRNEVIPMQVQTYSASLYECMTRINQTTEKRLLIDLRVLR